MTGTERNSYERETSDFQPATVTLDGVAVTDSVTFCVVPDGTRPAVFVPAVVRGARIGVAVAGMAPGNYDVYAKVDAPPDAPVINCGSFTVT